MCVPASIHVQYASQQNIDPVVEPKKSIEIQWLKKNKMWQIGAGGSFPGAWIISYHHSTVKYSVKVLF